MRAKKMKNILLSRLNNSPRQVVTYHNQRPQRQRHHHKSSQYLGAAIASFFLAIVLFLVGWIVIENLSMPDTFRSSSGIYIDIKEIAPLLLDEKRR